MCDFRREPRKLAMAGTDTSGTDTSGTVSCILPVFEVFAEQASVGFPDKWQDSFKDALALEQALQTVDFGALKSFVSNMAWTIWMISLSPTDWRIIIFSLIFPACNI